MPVKLCFARPSLIAISVFDQATLLEHSLLGCFEISTMSPPLWITQDPSQRRRASQMLTCVVGSAYMLPIPFQLVQS